MPRKKDDAEEIDLIPEADFEDAMRAVLNAPREKVNKRLAEMQASNKAVRESRKKPPKG